MSPYETIRQAMNGEPFTMSLTDTDEIKAVIDRREPGYRRPSRSLFLS